MPDYALLNKIVPELETLFQSIRWVEKLETKTGLVRSLKENLVNGAQKASASILQLKKILERLDYRYNPLVHIPLNIFLLWDLQQVFALEKWKQGKEKTVVRWFHVLAEMESLVTLATICFNHPQWQFPQLSSEHGILIAKEMGHPLIPVEKRINNSFAVEGSQQLSLITGSNMAGKSTFLRSAGINVVLAMMGSPVCATELIVSNMKVMSSMRVSDNLEENTSTFYAELKKLKQIIDAVKDHEKVLLLLDEILRGTNSADRHAGSKAFIKQLVKEKAFALVATHDLELTKLAEEFPAHIHNYHFDVQVKGDELYFDYILKEGICNSMNASLLMKKIGIEL
jgi:DNA mismatch repair ATPase MutS